MLPGDQQIPGGSHLLLYRGDLLLNSLHPGLQHFSPLPLQQADDGELRWQDEPKENGSIDVNDNDNKHLANRKVNMGDSIVGELTMRQVFSKTTISSRRLTKSSCMVATSSFLASICISSSLTAPCIQ